MTKFKIASTFLAGVLLSTYIATPASAQVQENLQSSSLVSHMNQAKNISGLVKSSTINSVTFTDGSALVQYDNYYIATDSNGVDEFKITKFDDNKVKYVNLQTGEVNYAISRVESIQEDTEFYANARISYDGYEYKGKVEHSTEIDYATASLVAGVLVSFIGGPSGPILGVLTTVASYYISLNGKRAYWIEKIYTKSEKISDYDARLYIRKDFHYYKYHDYTGFIETVSTHQICGPYGCGPVEYI
ncbi:adenosine deaminase [Paenibacillus sp. UMB4589-SE434]|uniref:adenosine deaminase n=1 Tax=Paenibacillus sp. UMB4589-SE434 TaxID=3046314 RepID=UPI00255017F0|nr:adenosine deaminase [Paenibacillus sp. UMB4589-SE434]MDK8180071.1 adenosine deaminase [Paenibacillus sp. UMB4589-SE434]